MSELTDKELIDWAVKNKRVDILVKHKWGFDLSTGQVEIVRKIAFLEHKRLSISAMTRYGKTQCVAFGIALAIDFGIPAKIAFLGPKQEQAGIIRQYLSELILADKSLLSKAQIHASGEERIGKEASRKRMTFNTGAEYRVFSGEGDADRLMGFGCVPPSAEIFTNEGVKTAEYIWKTNKKLMIYSYNHKKNKCEFQRIKHKIKNPKRELIKIYHREGSIIVTDNHPVYVKGKGYIQAKDVRNKDKLFNMSKLSLQDKLQEGDVEEVIVTRIEKKPAGKQTYNFEVEDNNNYFVDGILTHNCDILVRDEACLINRAAYTKSGRMLGDNPDEAVVIELYNPWNRDNLAFEHTMDPSFHVIQIGWEQAVLEERTTKKFVDQQRRDLTPLEFTVLYESRFPEQGEDSLFNLIWISEAEEAEFGFQKQLGKTLKEFRELTSKRNNMSSGEYESKFKVLKEELNKYTKIVACDPAEKGLDETVMIWGIEYENNYEVVGTWSESKSEPMNLVNKIVEKALSFIEPEIRGKINIDRIGIGSGPLSRLKQIIHREKNIKNIRVLGCHYGEKAMKKDIFHNKKAENYFRLADLMRDGMVDIPASHKLRHQLVSERWERTSTNRKIVKDPDDLSPDWGDALVYLIWKDKSGLAFGFA